MTPEEILQLKAEVREFKLWKEQKERQQIKFPLDIASKGVLQKDLLVTTGRFAEPVGILGSSTALEVKVGETILWILASPTN